MRWAAGLLAGLAAVLAMPAAAMAQEEDPLRGVWEGTIANLPVHACFDGSGGDGVYYYDNSTMQLIRLRPIEGSADGYVEAIGWGDPGDASWRVTGVAENTLTGTWRDADSSAPIRLERREWSGRDEYASPCESGSFMAPRLAGGQVTMERGELDGQTYARLIFMPPPHWRSDDPEYVSPVEIETFAIAEEQIGDRSINHLLAGVLPRGDIGDPYADCLASVIPIHGTDGDFSQIVRPELITARWVVAFESNGVYCGGAHGSYWQHRRVFDRNTGREIATESWLDDRALARETYESGADSYVYTSITDEFREVIRPHWEGGNELDCSDMVMAASTWDIGLAREGLALIPSLPHVGMACAETVVVPWADLEPFLTPDGQAVRLSMAAPQ